MLLKSAQVSGLAMELSCALGPWRTARSVHDPGKAVLDLAVTIALGGDCLADAAVLRAQPELFGAVASDPTISRLIDALGEDSSAAVAATRRARAAARATVWGHRCPVSPDELVVVDLDGHGRAQALDIVPPPTGPQPPWIAVAVVDASACCRTYLIINYYLIENYHLG